VLYAWLSQRRDEKRWHIVASWATAGVLMAILPTVMEASSYAGFVIFILCAMATCEWAGCCMLHACAAVVRCMAVMHPCIAADAACNLGWSRDQLRGISAGMTRMAPCLPCLRDQMARTASAAPTSWSSWEASAAWVEPSRTLWVRDGLLAVAAVT
jgi:hypothetical protein